MSEKFEIGGRTKLEFHPVYGPEHDAPIIRFADTINKTHPEWCYLSSFNAGITEANRLHIEARAKLSRPKAHRIIRLTTTGPGSSSETGIVLGPKMEVLAVRGFGEPSSEFRARTDAAFNITSTDES